MIINIEWIVGLTIVIVCCTGLTICEDEVLFEKYFRDRCYKYSSDARAFEHLQQSTTEFIKFSEFTFSHLPNEQITFCKNDRPQLEERIKYITQVLKTCVPKEERYLPDFIMESYAEFLHFLCYKSGQNVNAYFSDQGRECKAKIGNSTSSITNCFSAMYSPNKEYITKKALCYDIQVAKNCFTNILDQHCHDYKAFKDLNRKFFYYISKPCGGCQAHCVNSLLLIGCLLFVNHFKKLFID